MKFCSQYFPQFPSLYAHVAIRPKLETEREKEQLQLVQEAHFGLKQLLVKDKKQGRNYTEGSSADAILSLARRWAPDGEPIEIEGGGCFRGGVELPLSPWMQWDMEKCREFSANEQDLILLACYHTRYWIHRNKIEHCKKPKNSQPNLF